MRVSGLRLVGAQPIGLAVATCVNAICCGCATIPSCALLVGRIAKEPYTSLNLRASESTVYPVKSSA